MKNKHSNTIPEIMLLKKERINLMNRIRHVLKQELYDIIKVKKDKLAKEIAYECNLEPARISEILGNKEPSEEEPSNLSEITVRKLIKGGFIDADKLLGQTVNLTEKDRIFINKLRIYECNSINNETVAMQNKGVKVGEALSSGSRLAKMGVYIDKVLPMIEKLENKGVNVTKILALVEDLAEEGINIEKILTLRQKLK